MNSWISMIMQEDPRFWIRKSRLILVCKWIRRSCSEVNWHTRNSNRISSSGSWCLIWVSGKVSGTDNRYASTDKANQWTIPKTWLALAISFLIIPRITQLVQVATGERPQVTESLIHSFRWIILRDQWKVRMRTATHYRKWRPLSS